MKDDGLGRDGAGSKRIVRAKVTNFNFADPLVGFFGLTNQRIGLKGRFISPHYIFRQEVALHQIDPSSPSLCVETYRMKIIVS